MCFVNADYLPPLRWATRHFRRLNHEGSAAHMHIFFHTWKIPHRSGNKSTMSCFFVLLNKSKINCCNFEKKTFCERFTTAKHRSVSDIDLQNAPKRLKKTYLPFQRNFITHRMSWCLYSQLTIIGARGLSRGLLGNGYVILKVYFSSSFCKSIYRILLWNWYLDHVSDTSMLVQVMAWCRQATKDYLNQYWPRFIAPYDVTRSQWFVRTLQWRHNWRDGVSDHQPRDCLLNRLFRRRSKKTSKLCVAGLYAGNSPVTGEFPAQRASNAENVSIWWRHHKTVLHNYNDLDRT